MGLSTLCEKVFARPEWILAKEHVGLSGFVRKNLVVIKNKGNSSKPDYRLYLPEIVPLNEFNQIRWFADETWKRATISEMDQIIIEQDLFGPPAEHPLNLRGCTPRQGIPIKSRTQGDVRVAYLAHCEDAVIKKIPLQPSRVRFDLNQGYLQSSRYHYKFNPKSHMLFESISVKSRDGISTELARDADLLIRADIRNFFSMQFDSSDITSMMKSYRSERVGAFGTLGFYLNILFFKISLDLNTDVRFFESSTHIPMILTVPVDGNKRLHPKSGVLYSFILTDAVQTPAQHEMPILKDAPSSPAEGLKFCSDEVCIYKLTFSQVQPDAKALMMELKLPRSLVALGMFPHYVADVSNHAQDMKWSLSKTQTRQRRVGIYLEVSGLPKGEHSWDFWMELGN